MDIKDPLAVRDWRKAQRARLLDMRRAMLPDAHRAASETIMQTLVSRLPPAAQLFVGCYWPFRREFNCLPYMRDVVRSGGRIALPVVIARGRPLEFRRWTEESKMEPGTLNIPHPASGPAVSPPVLVIPLLGFDEAGFRLGYGAGYYDATIASLPERPIAVAVGFESCRLPSIFPQPHDRPMDVVITESRVREWSRPSGSPADHCRMSQ
ncbi:MAG TPA: 5-formyltetrahydrofolate cyclo-ligase [Rhizomicrobium sp.]